MLKELLDQFNPLEIVGLLSLSIVGITALWVFCVLFLPSY